MNQLNKCQISDASWCHPCHLLVQVNGKTSSRVGKVLGHHVPSVYFAVYQSLTLHCDWTLFSLTWCFDDNGGVHHLKLSSKISHTCSNCLGSGDWEYAFHHFATHQTIQGAIRPCGWGIGDPEKTTLIRIERFHHRIKAINQNVLICSNHPFYLDSHHIKSQLKWRDLFSVAPLNSNGKLCQIRGPCDLWSIWNLELILFQRSASVYAVWAHGSVLTLQLFPFQLMSRQLIIWYGWHSTNIRTDHQLSGNVHPYSFPRRLCCLCENYDLVMLVCKGVSDRCN